MKIAYIPANLAGAEASLAGIGIVVDPAEARAWIQKQTLRTLPGSLKRRDDFTTIMTGLGYTLGLASVSANPPTFELELDVGEGRYTSKDSLIEITYWIAPGT